MVYLQLRGRVQVCGEGQGKWGGPREATGGKAGVRPARGRGRNGTESARQKVWGDTGRKSLSEGPWRGQGAHGVPFVGAHRCLSYRQYMYTNKKRRGKEEEDAEEE